MIVIFVHCNVCTLPLCTFTGNEWSVSADGDPLVPWLKRKRILEKRWDTHSAEYKFVNEVVNVLEVSASGVSVERSFSNVRHIHAIHMRAMTSDNLMMNVSVYLNQRSLSEHKRM